MNTSKQRHLLLIGDKMKTT